MSDEERYQELVKERAAFERRLEQLLRDHRDQYVVFNRGEPRGFFPSYAEAYDHALDLFGLDEAFLITQVTDTPPRQQPLSRG